ncbi:MAG: helix-turn-helix domain-containing protein [Acidobacteria bacterium]|nr:helix-turn-helix domain-containing protein [Acidobacteriota bacterium]
MQETGLKLKKQREERGLTLGEIEKTTKISVRLLKKIESGDFQALPSGVFARNFVRQYCEAIGTNPEVILKEVFGPETESEPEFPVPVSEETSRRGILIFIFVFVLIIVGFFVLRHGEWLPGMKTGNRNSQFTTSPRTSLPARNKGKSLPRKAVFKAPPQETQGKKAAAQVEKSADMNMNKKNKPVKTTAAQPVIPGSAPAVAEKTGNQDVAPGTGKEKSTGVSIRFEADEKCWVHLRCPEKEMDFILMKGELYSITCRAPAVVSVGNAEHIRVFVNNVRIEFPSGKRVVKDFDLTRTASTGN